MIPQWSQHFLTNAAFGPQIQDGLHQGYIKGDKELITAELELEVTKSSTCTSLADDNSPMALEPEAENEVSPSPVKKAKRLGAILSKLPTAEVSTEVSMAEKFKREVGSYLD